MWNPVLCDLIKNLKTVKSVTDPKVKQSCGKSFMTSSICSPVSEIISDYFWVLNV